MTHEPFTPAATPRRRTPLIALAVAIFAVLLSATTALLSWRAADRADATGAKVDALASSLAIPATTTNTPAPIAESPADAPIADPPANPSADPPADSSAGGEIGTDAEPGQTPTGSVPTLNAQTKYEPRYTDQTLRLSSGCNDSLYVDLDEPRVKVDDSIADLLYQDPCGDSPAAFRLQSDVSGSAVSSEKVTPIECAEQIRTSPMSTEESVPVRRGSVYCVATSLNAANNTGISWKMVVVSVTATAQDGSVTLKASAWDIPS